MIDYEYEKQFCDMFLNQSELAKSIAIGFFPGEPDLVEDIVSITFYNIWRSKPQISSKKGIVALTARNVCIDTIRKRRRREIVHDVPDVFSDHDEWDPESVVDHMIHDAESVKTLESGWRNLSSIDKQALVNWYLVGEGVVKQNQYAGLMGITPGALKSRLHDARRRFKS